MQVKAIKTEIFKEGGSLLEFIQIHIPRISEGSIIAVTSKIVSLSENRTSHERMQTLVRKESNFFIKTKLAYLTLTKGMLIPNAGIDASNGNGKHILLPKNSFQSAEMLRKELMSFYKVRKLGILVTDSTVSPLRTGTTALALGYAGFRGIKDYRNTRDLFGRVFSFSQVNIADSLATAAALLMGEGRECQPLALITQAPVIFTSKSDKERISIPLKEDLFAPLIRKISKS